MWLAIKEAAGRAKIPPDSMLVDQLGDPEAARQYKRWARDYPEVERGPDGDILDHYNRLKGAFERENKESGESQGPRSRGLTVDKRPEVTERATPRDVPPAVRTPEELKAEQTWENFSPSNGLPTRIPGQYTTGNPEFGTKPFPDWEVPPANQPLHTAPRAPMRAPEPQSMQDWVSFLRGKGITLNHQLMRPDAVQMQGPMPQGQDIWRDFIGPTTTDSMHQYLKDQPAGPNTFGTSLTKRVKDFFGGRRIRSSTIVTEYISGVLTGEVLPKIAAAGDSYEDHVAKFNARQKMMKDDGWNFHESGSGNWWEHPETGHKIMYDTARDRDGNIQEGYTHHKPGGVPTFYPSFHEALLASKVGSLGHISVKPPLGPRLNAA